MRGTVVKYLSPYWNFKNLAIVILVSSIITSLIAGELYELFPENINPDERYVIYSHGLILEGNISRPEHTNYGIYEFRKIKEVILENGGFNLIAHHRPVNTDIDNYVETLVSWVETLVESGVKPSRITLVGFSRGSHLTAFASDKLRDHKINTALLASCMKGNIPVNPPLDLGGNLFSIYETTDVMGTCAQLAQNSRSLESFEEVSITTGQAHGAFFRPLDEWVLPLKQWISKTNR